MSSAKRTEKALFVWLGLKSSNHLDFVIAHEVNELMIFAEFQQKVDDAFGVGTTINVIAEGDDKVFARGLDLSKEAGERRETTVNVTDGKFHEIKWNRSGYQREVFTGGNQEDAQRAF